MIDPTEGEAGREKRAEESQEGKGYGRNSSQLSIRIELNVVGDTDPE
jgi:hypothetical protein